MTKANVEILINCGCGQTFAGYSTLSGIHQITKAFEEAQLHASSLNHILHIQGKITPQE